MWFFKDFIVNQNKALKDFVPPCGTGTRIEAAGEVRERGSRARREVPGGIAVRIGMAMDGYRGERCGGAEWPPGIKFGIGHDHDAQRIWSIENG